MGYRAASMVSVKDREHFRRIAEYEAELNREAIRESAARTPGENIALGFALSEFAMAFGADLSRPEEVSPAHLWRARVVQHTPDP
jgi:hypothetical protein